MTPIQEGCRVYGNYNSKKCEQYQHIRYKQYKRSRNKSNNENWYSMSCKVQGLLNNKNNILGTCEQLTEIYRRKNETEKSF